MSEIKTEALGASPAALFQGYNSVLGSGLSTAVTGESVTGGASSEVRCSVCVTTTELANSLQIDQSLSVGFGPLGGIDQKLSFMNSLNVTTYSVSVTVYSRHVKGTRSMTDVRLKDGVKAPTTTAEVNDFVRFYGDCFLSDVVEGGEYMAVYTFYSETREEQTKVVSSLHASGVFDGITVGGSLQVALNNYLRTSTTRYSFQQKVSGIMNPTLPDPADFVSYAVKFPSIPLDAPVVIGIAATGYETVPGIGAVFQPVAENRLYFTGDSVNGGLTAKLTRINEIDNQMTWIAETYRFYGGYTDKKLVDNQVVAKADLKAIDAQMTQFSKEATATFPPLALKSLDNGSPTLSYAVGTSPMWGGGGGGPFDDVDLTTYIHNHNRIQTVRMRTGSRVDQLSVTYNDGTRTHGGGGGSERETLQLLDGQFVIRLNGRSGARVDQLHVTITDNRSTGGGGDGGGAFDWDVPPGAFVLGFRGRSGAELDAVGVTYAHFNPASWIPVTID